MQQDDNNLKEPLLNKYDSTNQNADQPENYFDTGQNQRRKHYSGNSRDGGGEDDDKMKLELYDLSTKGGGGKQMQEQRKREAKGIYEESKQGSLYERDELRTDPSMKSKRTESKEALQKILNKITQKNKAGVDNAAAEPGGNSPKKKSQTMLAISICVYNSLENILIFLISLNALFYPNLVSALYLVIALLLTTLSLTKSERKIKIKLSLSILLLLIALASIITKSVYLIKYHKKSYFDFSPEIVSWLKSFGIYIEETAPYMDNMDIFMTVFFDLTEILLAVMIICLYKSQLTQLRLAKADPLKQILLLNPIFFLYFGVQTIVVLSTILIDTMFVQTFFQLMLMVALLLILALWAAHAHGYTSTRHMIMMSCQALFVLQLVLTFAVQVPILNAQVKGVISLETACDMFGLLVHYLQTYSIVVHFVAMCFGIQAIQVYKVSRINAIKYLPFVAPVEEEQTPQQQPALKKQGTNQFKRTNALVRRTTIRMVSGEVRRGSTSAASELKQKNLLMKKQQEETVQQTAQKYYKQFAPYIWLWVCRGLTFVWCYAYHDYQSLFILFWLLHSTIISNTPLFLKITIFFYFPIFICIFLFYFTINIPKVVNFQKNQLQGQEFWWDIGFFEFSYPFLEVGLMFIGLIPFFLLVHYRKYAKPNDVEVKNNFLKKLCSKDSPTFYYVVLVSMYYLDILVYITIFFSGVNKIDFYHIFLLFFLVAYTLFPTCFKKHFIVLLIYSDLFVFEKYLYTLVDQYIDPYGFYAGFASVMGFSTDYNQDKKYFRYTPKFQQWFLIIVCFLQYQVYMLLDDPKKVQECLTDAKTNFTTRYPRITHGAEVMYHLLKELLIFFCFVIFFIMVIVAEKNLLNWGYLIIIGIFLMVYSVVSNSAPPRTGWVRLMGIWNLIIYYTSIVLLAIITFQFLALPEIASALNLNTFFDKFPEGIPAILGFQIYTSKIWEKFLLYMVFFAIGVIVSKLFKSWSRVYEQEEESRNSDMQSYFSAKKQTEYRWGAEYMKVRFTKEYLIYKIKAVWPFLDKLCQLLFVITSILIMILANYWQISFAMLFNLICFISICLIISKRLFTLREAEKALYFQDQNTKVLKKELSVEEIQDYWNAYKEKANKAQVSIRESVWFVQFIFVVLCVIIIYPSCFYLTFYQDFTAYKSLWDYLIFYSFWGGVYYAPKGEYSDYNFFYNVYGYLVILVLLLLEKAAQRWALDRFGCTAEKINWFNEIVEGMKEVKEKSKTGTVIQEKPEEEEEDKEDDDDVQQQRFRTRKRVTLQSLTDESQDRNSSPMDTMQPRISGGLRDSTDKIEEVKEESDSKSDPLMYLSTEKKIQEIKVWMRKEYKIKLLVGVKILVEEMVQLMLLISAVYKDNAFSMVYLLIVFFYAYSRKVSSMVILTYVVGVVMVLEYLLALTNLTSTSSPMAFPYPFQDYPYEIPDQLNEFIVPWYQRVPFLTGNSGEWCLWLGICNSNVKLNGIWIDYLTMGLIQAYFLYFNCQLFALDYKVIKGATLSELMNQYCLDVCGSTLDHVIKKEEKRLKNQLFIYNLYKKGQITMFMNFHLVTIVTTLVLAILSTSLFSFGYIICCLYMVYVNPKFFNRQQKGYNLHGILRFFLRPYVFLDITLQLAYQVPITALHEDQTLKNSWQNIIGFYQIWQISTDPDQPDVVNTANVVYVILKTFTYFFVSLQIQIFSSKAYKLKFVEKDLNMFLDQAETKSHCITYKFNNIKLQKIARFQNEKKNMETLLIELKKKLKKWQKIYFDPESQPDKKPPPAAKPVKRGSFIEDNITQEPTDQQQDDQEHTLTPVILQVVKPSVKQRKQSAQLYDRKEVLQQIKEDDELELEESEELQKRIKKLNCCVRLYLYMKVHVVEQLIFITNDKKLTTIYEDMRKGKVKIQTKLEQKMLKDMRHLKQKRKEAAEEDQDQLTYGLEGMTETKRFIKCGHLTVSYLALFLEILVTYSEYVCYFLMIVCMMVSAGLLTLFYPLIVFGYAILEETNPSKGCWYVILIYTMFLISIMFIYQLEFWAAIFNNAGQLEAIGNRVNGMHLGLQRISTGDFGQMFGYFLPEILVLFALMAHMQKEILLGLFEYRETQIETIRQAMARYLLFIDKKGEEKSTAIPLVEKEQLEEEREFDVFRDVHFGRDVKRYEKAHPKARSIGPIDYAGYDYSPNLSEEGESIMEEFKEPEEQPQEVQVPRKRSHSMVDKRELTRIYAEILEREKLEEGVKVTTVQKFTKTMASIFYKNYYFERLFPSIKEQKPGVDFYSAMFSFQLLIAIYLIFFYTRMQADVTTNMTDALTYNQFSGQMVVALFLQILIIAVDRYLYKAKTFISVQEAPTIIEKPAEEPVVLDQTVDIAPGSVDKAQSLDRSQSNMFENKSFYSNMQKSSFQKFIGDQLKIMDDHESLRSSDASKIEGEIEKQFEFQQTKITFAIVAKFYLQWFLLLFIHSFVFFYFPITGNVKLQGQRYCDYSQASLGVTQCNEFDSNWTLIVFYILYCFYFLASGLQIKYGVAEMRKGNFMMWTYAKIPSYIFRGYMTIPFLFESKTLADWAFTSTSLDIFQWFNLSNTHATLYIQKTVQIGYRAHPLGKPQPGIMKFFLGYLGLLGIIVLIAGPLVLFSTFNPISEGNPVINAKIDFNILIQDSDSRAVNSMNIYTNNYVQELADITQNQYDVMNFDTQTRTKSFLQNQIQFVVMNNFSDTNWDISDPNKEQLKQEFVGVQANTSSSTLRLELQYEFDRQNPPGAQKAYGAVVKQISMANYPEVIEGFNQIFSLNCTDPDSPHEYTVNITNFFYPAISLSELNKALMLPLDPFQTNGISVYYSCKNYWAVSQYFNESNYESGLIPSMNNTGIAFFLFSYKIAPSYFKYSLVTFYVSIVLVLGQLLRSTIAVATNNIFIYEMIFTDPLLMLCECIYIYRMQNQLEKEEELYYVLMDVMRSPEMIKTITGSSLKKKID